MCSLQPCVIHKAMSRDYKTKLYVLVAKKGQTESCEESKKVERASTDIVLLPVFVAWRPHYDGAFPDQDFAIADVRLLAGTEKGFLPFFNFILQIILTRASNPDTRSRLIETALRFLFLIELSQSSSG